MQVVIISAKRTPIGRWGPTQFSAVELGTVAAKAAVKQPGLIQLRLIKQFSGMFTSRFWAKRCTANRFEEWDDTIKHSNDS